MNLPPQPETVSSVGQMFSKYRSVPNIYDEAVSTANSPRPHWKQFLAEFEKLGPEELSARWENGQRIIKEHGVTYNIYGDPQGIERPWELDLLPLLIDPAEWRKIEEGLIQRCRLFNLILQDLYGLQKLLRTGLLPPALLFANPGFLRPCHGIRVPEGIFVHLHAADLARSPKGEWWVLADRTQAPSGSGYALENRIVLSRILPDQFRDCHVQRLASFFAMQRETLRRIAPRQPANPNVVVLTPGPLNETYFEHAYLARYLGFTLVEGADLTVRDQQVFLKTLEGLQQVDVIFRRVDDAFCDPLELRNESFLGVAGLVEAVRSANVAVANALGSSVVESAAFLAFLPNLSRELLGEDLKLPSVATWWCGQEKEKQYVLEHIDQIVVKPAFGHVSRLPFFGRDLTKKKREELVTAIRERPSDFVGQEQVAFSTTPTWVDNKLEPRGIVLRAYTAAAAKSFTVMPGGLTRVSAREADPVVSMQSGGGSKDTWVLSDGPVLPLSLLSSSGQPVAASRSPAELPSRVADNLFWLGRYSERLEGTLRLVRCVISRMSDETGMDTTAELTSLVQLLVFLGRIPKHFSGRVPLHDLEHEVLQMVYSPQKIGTIRELVLRIRHIISTVRDRFSSDTWRILNQLQLDSRTRPGRLPLSNALALINNLIVDLAAFSGMEMENMTRGHGWRFLDFGRRLERGISLVEIIRAGILADRAGTFILSPLLEIADSSMTYRRRYFAQPQLGSVLDLLLVDKGNPRSLAFQLHALKDHGSHLPRDPNTPAGKSGEERHIAMLARIKASDINVLCNEWSNGRVEPLSNWLQTFSDELAAVSTELTELYFSLTVGRGSQQ
jgi:uncharacterized circularly permuted ATP-grasp superfamily protein/uncharacterized alpha-E superfamily protein